MLSGVQDHLLSLPQLRIASGAGDFAAVVSQAIRRLLLLMLAGAGLPAHSAYTLLLRRPYRRHPALQQPGLVSAGRLGVGGRLLVFAYVAAQDAVWAGAVAAGAGLDRRGGTGWPIAHPFAREPASQVWGVIHGGSILLATVAVLLGFAAGVTYLSQAWRLKRKLPLAGGLRLPSLEWLRTRQQPRHPARPC